MASGSPNESTASRLQRIGRRSDRLSNERQGAPDELLQDQNEVEEQAVHDEVHLAAEALHNDLLDQEVVHEEANCTDLEPDSSDEARNVPWGSSNGASGGQREPSNFSVNFKTFYLISWSSLRLREFPYFREDLI